MSPTVNRGFYLGLLFKLCRCSVRVKINNAKPHTLWFYWVFGFSVIIRYGHSCASLLLSLGYSMKDIQEWLGHSNFQTTANIYSHVDPRNKKDMIRGLSNVLGANGRWNTAQDFCNKNVIFCKGLLGRFEETYTGNSLELPLEQGHIWQPPENSKASQT